MKISKYIIIFFIINNLLFSQTDQNKDKYSNFGISADYLINIDKANFKALPDMPLCCPKFSTSFGSGYSFGLVYDYIFSDLGINFRANYRAVKGTFNSSENEVMSLNGEPVNGQFEYNIDHTINLTGLNINLMYYLTTHLNLSAGFGLNYTLSSNFSQYEKIVQPAGKVTFLDSNGNDTHKFTRNERNGSITKLNRIGFTGNVSIGYELPLRRDYSLKARPELGFTYSFTQTVKSINWQMMGISFGVSVLFSNGKTEKYSDIVQSNEVLKRELENAKYIKDSIENNLRLQDSLRLARLASEKREKYLRDSISDYRNSQIKLENDRIEEERLAMIRAINEENQRTGKICHCYEVQFFSSTDRKEADELLEKIKASGITRVSISQFVEPYLKQKYFRIRTDCFNDFNDAFDFRIKYNELFKELNIQPLVVCDK